MTQISTVKLTFGILLLVLFSSIGAAAQKKTDCANVTDADIVKTIYDQMKKKPSLDNQILHVNVRSQDGVVTLEGWTTTTKIRKEIEKIARKIKCVKRVDNRLGSGALGCGPGQKKCGSICIGTEETCNICTAKTCL